MARRSFLVIVLSIIHCGVYFESLSPGKVPNFLETVACKMFLVTWIGNCHLEKTCVHLSVIHWEKVNFKQCRGCPYPCPYKAWIFISETVTGKKFLLNVGEFILE